MSGPVQVVLILAAVCYVMVRRMRGEPAQGKRLLLLPAVLVVLGLSDMPGDVNGAVSVLFLVATGAISVVLGGLRGVSVRVSERDGVAFVNYTGVTVALWVVNLVVKFGANAVLAVLDGHDVAAVSNSLFLTLGAGMLAEGAVVLIRVLRGGARVMWAAGEDGGPHTTSPFLDGLRDRVPGGATTGPGRSLSANPSSRRGSAPAFGEARPRPEQRG
jgi:hypothetical protein